MRLIIFLLVMFMVTFKAVEILSQLPQEKEPQVISHQVEYKAGDLKDPFESPRQKQNREQDEAKEEEGAAPLPNLAVQGIVWGGRLPQAIINNKVLKIGEMLDEVKIINIGRDGITVSFKEKEHKLSSPAIISLDTFKKTEEFQESGGKKNEK